MLLLMIVLLFLICDRKEVMLRMVTEYMEQEKAKSNSQWLYSIKREVVSYQLAQHSLQHSRAAAPGCSE
jgi:hypothetical protein